MRVLLIILALIAWAAAVWIGGPMIPWGPLSTVWLRVTLIAIPLVIVFTIWLIRLRRRRKAARELEDALVPAASDGDGKELAERMNAALSVLKKSGGKSYLYDLPWYVIIGPPGAGKTTALRNSGIEFPVSEGDGGVVEGFGGTRYTDWWFSEEAVLIDTAGRYTTQDSDQEADQNSWNAFLGLLKKSRADQPINGVILAFSVEDMLTASPDELATHAATVRARLAEIHETLRIDFPVYVLFTKADLISGFREYFSSFSLNRRKSVWGVTFQNKDRTAQTHEQVKDEFDLLVSRLSDEIIDRMNEEPDGVSRIAIFGLPGQMALMRDNVADFLRQVFEPTRYKTNAILRGFYFTSGTQEGTPIDQVLGALNEKGEVAAYRPAFMSGKGKSFFLHDLLRRVIFEERDWVSFDRKAVRRATILRGIGMTLLTVTTLGLLAAFGFSYWRNTQLVSTAQVEAIKYERAAFDEIRRDVVDDADLRPILPYLNALRDAPAGYGQSEEVHWYDRFGLSQQSRLELANETAYADALEKMLRPRLILDLERQMPAILDEGDRTRIYRALKVYLLLGGAGERPDTAAVTAWFDDVWRNGDFASLTDLDARQALIGHLGAMLELDDTRDIAVPLDDTTVSRAREAIVQMPLVDQAYVTIAEGAASVGLPDFSLMDAAGPSADLVFTTRDGSDLSNLTVSALYTYEGFWGYFFPQLEEVAARLQEDQWVLGDAAARVDFEGQIAGLDRALLSRYRQEFKGEWDAMLGNLALASMSADKPRFDALGAAASPVASPLLLLVKAISAETKLTAEVEGLDQLDPAALADGAGEVGDQVGNALASRLRSRSTGVQRILLDAVSGQAKDQTRANGSSESPFRPIERIEEDFEQWHLMLEGPDGARPMDAILSDLTDLWSNQRLSTSNPAQSAAMLPELLSNLTRNTSRQPEPIARMVASAEQDFRSEARDASLEEMNRALTNRIAVNCREVIAPSFPFANSARALSMREFGQFFGPGGDMDTYFNEYLSPHVERSSDGLAWRADSPLSGRLSENALRQFDRAEKIRRAFFGSGSTTPEVLMNVSIPSAHSTIELVQFEVNGTTAIMVPGEPPKAITWPGAGAAAVLEISPALDRASQLRSAAQGPWSIVAFLRGAASKQWQGDTLLATYNIGGRPVVLQVTVDAWTNAFLMRELTEFQCPTSMD